MVLPVLPSKHCSLFCLDVVGSAPKIDQVDFFDLEPASTYDVVVLSMVHLLMTEDVHFPSPKNCISYGHALHRY